MEWQRQRGRNESEGARKDAWEKTWIEGQGEKTGRKIMQYFLPSFIKVKALLISAQRHGVGDKLVHHDLTAEVVLH